MSGAELRRRAALLGALGAASAGTLGAASTGTLGASLSAPALAQPGFPSRPIRFVVPFAAGGVTDAGARLLGRRVGELLGQTVVVENRSGGAGAIAAAAVIEAPPDGHTLFFGGQAVIITNRHLYERLSYRPEALLPVSLGVRVPLVLAVHPAFPAQSLPEFLRHVRARPGEVGYGTVGRGGMTHVFGELLEATAGLDMLDVPYRGSGPAMQDLLGGQIRVMVDGLVPDITHHRAGALRILAVSTPERIAAAPDVPTFTEQGLPEMEAFLWFGLFAPRGTPRPVIDRLSAAMREAAAHPSVRDAIGRDGVETVGSTPEELAALIAREDELWGGVIRRVGIRLSE